MNSPPWCVDSFYWIDRWLKSKLLIGIVSVFIECFYHIILIICPDTICLFAMNRFCYRDRGEIDTSVGYCGDTQDLWIWPHPPPWVWCIRLGVWWDTQVLGDLTTKVPGPCSNIAIWRYRKTFSQWEHSSRWKLRCHWLEGLRQLQTTLEISDPGAPTITPVLASILISTLYQFTHLCQWNTHF